MLLTRDTYQIVINLVPGASSQGPLASWTHRDMDPGTNRLAGTGRGLVARHTHHQMTNPKLGAARDPITDILGGCP